MLYVGQLRQAKDRAEADLTAIARRDQAEAALKDPRSAEARAGRERADAAVNEAGSSGGGSKTTSALENHW